MPRRILLLDGHPDPDPARFLHALADAYAAGATEGGHAVERIGLAALDIPFLRGKAEWDHAPAPPAVLAGQEAIRRAEHLVLFYPLWLGTFPALLHAFLEQALRPGFAVGTGQGSKGWAKLLSGRSARIVVTMGMPAFVYRWWFGAHSLKALHRNTLGFVGFAPIRDTLIGTVEGMTPAQRAAWLERMRRLGRAAR